MGANEGGEKNAVLKEGGGNDGWVTELESERLGSCIVGLYKEELCLLNKTK